MKATSGKAFARLLESHEWSLQRINGSHHIYAKPGNSIRISVPIHGNASLKVGFPRYLTKLAGLPAVGTSPGPNVPRNLAQNGPPAVDNGSWRVLLLNKQDAGEG